MFKWIYINNELRI